MDKSDDILLEMKDPNVFELSFLVKVYKKLENSTRRDTERVKEGAEVIFGLNALNVLIKYTLPSLYKLNKKGKQLEHLFTLLNRIFQVIKEKEHLLNLKLYDYEKLLSNLANRLVEGLQYSPALDILSYTLSRLYEKIPFKKTSAIDALKIKIQDKSSCTLIQKNAEAGLSVVFKKQSKSVEKISLIVAIWTNIIRIWVLGTEDIDEKV